MKLWLLPAGGKERILLARQEDFEKWSEEGFTGLFIDIPEDYPCFLSMDTTPPLKKNKPFEVISPSIVLYSHYTGKFICAPRPAILKLINKNPDRLCIREAKDCWGGIKIFVSCSPFFILSFPRHPSQLVWWFPLLGSDSAFLSLLECEAVWGIATYIVARGYPRYIEQMKPVPRGFVTRSEKVEELLRSQEIILKERERTYYCSNHLFFTYFFDLLDGCRSKNRNDIPPKIAKMALEEGLDKTLPILLGERTRVC